MLLCKDCRWARAHRHRHGTVEFYCTSPDERPRHLSDYLVTGPSFPDTYLWCGSARDIGKCGPEARFFEPAFIEGEVVADQQPALPAPVGEQSLAQGWAQWLRAMFT